ncbi:MAG: serine/threonine protein kinase [Planctomycetota bacterium]|jgi:serine/threonine protein kinase
MNDVEFLALLVHREHLSRTEAQQLVPRLKEGATLDDLLIEDLGWSEEKVDEMRRTRAGEIPELPGFDVLGKIGTGGTADVFKAADVRQGQRGQTVALKVLQPASTAHAPTRKAFIAEARLLQKLSHPNLISCSGVARSGNTFFSMLEYIEGHTALELLDERGAFTEEEALRVILGAAEALRYLSGEGVVHRDVKPGNVMITKDNKVKLIDLGFAVSVMGEAAGGEASDASETTVGTAAYLSPEQARGAAMADSRSDVYSLGVSLFHLVVGHLPFEGSDDGEILRKQVMDSLSSPELKGRGISPHLHYFIEKMVAKDVEDRYQGFDELIADIEQQLRGRDEMDFGAEAKRRSKAAPIRRRRR